MLQRTTTPNTCKSVKAASEVLEVGEAERGAEVFAEFDPVLLGDGHEDVHDFGVELGAGAALNFLAGVLNGQSFAVGAVADHGVEGIGDSEDTGAEGNLLAFELAGIAGAIEKFLMG